MLQQECSVFMGENMKLNEIYYEEFLNRAEELEAVEQEIEEKEVSFSIAKEHGFIVYI